MDRDLLIVPFRPSLVQGIEPSERALAWLADHGFKGRLTFPKAGLTNIVHAMRADGLRPAYVRAQDALERMYNLPAREVAR
jgi:hypothetical protein